MPYSSQDPSTNSKQKLKFSKKTFHKQKSTRSQKSHSNNEAVNPAVREILSKMQNLYRKTIKDFYPHMPKAPNIFDSELMAKTFSETQQVLVETFVKKPHVWDEKNKKYLKDLDRLNQYIIDRFQGEQAEPIISPKKGDKRFNATEWQDLPAFDYLKQAYLLQSDHISEMIQSLDDISPKTKEKVEFYVRSYRQDRK